MIEPDNSDLHSPLSEEEERVEAIVASGPMGAIALAGVATTSVVCLWLIFYLHVFLPRGALQ